MSNKNVLDKLNDKQRSQLMYAFEHQFSQYITLRDGSFIGVNVGPVRHLQTTESAGVWSVGVDHSKKDK